MLVLVLYSACSVLGLTRYSLLVLHTVSTCSAVLYVLLPTAWEPTSAPTAHVTLPIFLSNHATCAWHLITWVETPGKVRTVPYLPTLSSRSIHRASRLFTCQMEITVSSEHTIHPLTQVFSSRPSMALRDARPGHDCPIYKGRDMDGRSRFRASQSRDGATLIFEVRWVSWCHRFF